MQFSSTFARHTPHHQEVGRVGAERDVAREALMREGEAGGAEEAACICTPWKQRSIPLLGIERCSGIERCKENSVANETEGLTDARRSQNPL